MLQSPDTKGGFSGYGLPVLSGVLLGISFPTYPFIRLELLAWIALVPLLVSLRGDLSFSRYFGRVYLAMLTFCSIALWWVSLATLPGGVLTIIAQAFCSTVPLLLFNVLKYCRGYRLLCSACLFCGLDGSGSISVRIFRSVGWCLVTLKHSSMQ